MKTKYEEIELGKFKKLTKDSPEWSINPAPTVSDPYTMYFVYAPNGNFVVKGMPQETTEYVNKKFPLCFYYYSYWKNGKSRGSWGAHGMRLRHLSPYPRFGARRKNRKYLFETLKGVELMRVRHIPKHWVKELEAADEFYLLVAADYLEDNNFGAAADYLRKSVGVEPARLFSARLCRQKGS